MNHMVDGGGGGIRTPVPIAREAVFKTARFIHSRTPPPANSPVHCSFQPSFVAMVASLAVFLDCHESVIHQRSGP